MINDKADKIIKGLFESLLNRCQTGLETLTRGSDFIFSVFIICIVTLYREEIEQNTKRVSKIKTLVSKQNWKGVNYPSGKGDWTGKSLRNIIQ